MGATKKNADNWYYHPNFEPKPFESLVVSPQTVKEDGSNLRRQQLAYSCLFTV